jgi:hypothetical protein
MRESTGAGLIARGGAGGLAVGADSAAPMRDGNSDEGRGTPLC